MTITTCKMCAAPLQKPPSGPMPTYCGEGCKQAARRAVRRLDASLAQLEDEARYHRKAARFGTGSPDHHLAVAEYLAEEIAAAENRMRDLSSEGDHQS